MPRVTNRIQIRQAVVYVRSSLWFVPTVMIVLAAVTAVGLAGIDQETDAALKRSWPRLFANDAEGARAMLAAIATSMATIAGVVFSITVVALQLASTQYTSRVLRNFMRDRATQAVLGSFVSVYVYCLVVLRTSTGGSVPGVAVFVGVLLAIVAIGFFIFFIHHISAAIQASEIVHSITCATRDAIDRFFPDEVGEDSEEGAEGLPPDTVWFPVAATGMGYVERVDGEALVALARQYGTVVRMECAIGDFIAPGRTLLSIAARCLPSDVVVRQANEIYAVGSYRTIEQDPPFGMRQLVDISLKALSPSVNHTTTAVICIEHLSFLLCRCAKRRAPAVHRSDDGQLRVIAKVVGFERLVALSFGQILENAERNSEVLFRLLRAMTDVALVTSNAGRREALRQWVEAIAATAWRTERAPHGHALIEEHLAKAREALIPHPGILAAARATPGEPVVMHDA